MVKGLPGLKWSDEFGMPYLTNCKGNPNLIFETFRGVAWLNCNSFFGKALVSLNEKAPEIDHYRKRALADGFRACPEDFLKTLEVRKYSLNTKDLHFAI
ncbi:MAG: hypothetical protein AAF519_12000 [Bacteroidota bacterium]